MKTKLSVKHFYTLIRAKLSNLEASSIPLDYFFKENGDKELRYLEQKQIITIRKDYIYEQIFQKILCEATTNLIY